jgi:hypothetical protein
MRASKAAVVAGERQEAAVVPEAAVVLGVALAEPVAGDLPAGKGQSSVVTDPFAGLAVGRIVHFVLPECRASGAHRAAMVVNTECRDGINNLGFGIVDLAVFAAPGDGGRFRSPVCAVTCVRYAPEGRAGCWHWPERAE